MVISLYFPELGAGYHTHEPISVVRLNLKGTIPEVEGIGIVIEGFFVCFGGLTEGTVSLLFLSNCTFLSSDPHLSLLVIQFDNQCEVK